MGLHLLLCPTALLGLGRRKWLLGTSKRRGRGRGPGEGEGGMQEEA